VVVIEHNLEVIKTADWIIDLGPEGGDGGGEIVAAGSPEDIVREKRSYTGTFLKPVLARRGADRGKKKRVEAAE
jgi:excinuclease ABC subunit A